MELEKQLLVGVEAILGKNGIQTKHGLNFLKKQLDYARHVAIGLARGTDIMASMTLLEAAPGTGKSIGYLVPIALYSAITGKRVGVSTFTLQLQRQIFNKDVPVVAAMVFDYLGKKVTFARRFGLRNFVSHARLVEVLADIDTSKYCEEDVILAKAFVEFAAASMKKNTGASGEIAEFMSDYGITRLPFGLHAEQICLTSDCPEEYKTGYLQHAKEAMAADIVIANHALTFLHTRRSFNLLDGDRPISSLVVDEADRFPEVAESMMSKALPVHYVKNLLSKFDHPVFAAAAKAAEKLSAHLAKVRDDRNETDIIFVDDNRHALSGEVTRFAAALSLVPQATPAIIGGIDKVLAESLVDLLVYCDRMKDMEDSFSIDGGYASLIPIVSFSPAKNYPTLALRPVNAGYYLSRLWLPRKADYNDPSAGESLYLESCLMTSATLGDPAQRDPDHRFSHFMASCGIFDKVSMVDALGKMIGKRQVLNINHDLFASFSPSNFGNLTFYLADPGLPKPLMKVDDEADMVSDDMVLAQTEPHPIWVNYVCNTTVFAANKMGGNTLVLTGSHRDTEIIGKKLYSLDESTRPKMILIQEKGKKVGDFVDTYKTTPGAVLVTAGGWEGLDLPGLVNNLIITRLPFGGKDGVRNKVFIHWLVKYRGMSHSDAKIMLMLLYRAAARRKLTQGIGRANRSSSDKCNVFITDPRFPPVDSAAIKQAFGGMSLDGGRAVRGDSMFHYSVPDRFFNSLENAKILRVDGSVFDPLVPDSQKNNETA